VPASAADGLLDQGALKIGECAKELEATTSDNGAGIRA
jgi:hypothetical protein